MSSKGVMFHLKDLSPGILLNLLQAKCSQSRACTHESQFTPRLSQHQPFVTLHCYIPLTYDSGLQ